MTKKEQEMHKYVIFKSKWELTHRLSKAPSFSSWKEFYREKDNGNTAAI